MTPRVFHIDLGSDQDWWVYFDDGTSLPLADFLLDEPEFTMPPGAVRCDYIPGVRVAFFDADGNQFGWPAEPGRNTSDRWTRWPEVDAMKGRTMTYRINQVSRLAERRLAEEARKKGNPQVPTGPTLDAKNNG